MREILQVDVQGTTLIGTYHRPARARARMRSGQAVPAMLLLNFGQVRRSGPRNLSAAIGDRLASAGYPVFRFDMPGLGDTVGDLPVYRETYWRFVEDGGHVRPVCGLIAALQEEHHQGSFVLGGLCGGAVTAVYVAERNRTDVRGVVLLEPAVRHTPLVRAETMAGSEPPAVQPKSLYGSLDERIHGYLHSTRLRARKIRPLDPLRRGYRKVQQMISGFRGEHYPQMMNGPFLRCWEKLEGQVPSLVLMAPGSDRDFIKNQLFRPERRQDMEMIDVDDTNHLFIAATAGRRPSTSSRAG